MANTVAPIGFRHLGALGGASPTFGMFDRLVLKTDGNKIFQGDPVKSLSSGYVGAWTAGTAVSQLAGIFVGCEYLSTAQGKRVFSSFWGGADAAADVTVHLIPCNLDVPQTFLVQASGATGILFADIGQTVDVNMGTGSTITGISNATADQTTLGAETTKPFRVMALGSSPTYLPNDNTLANNWIIVAANVAGAGSTGI